MRQIPRDPLPESTLALIRDPYRFISKRCERYQPDLFQTTLMLQRTVCMRGHQAAALFYGPQRFARAGVAPTWLQKRLFGVGGVQRLDGAAHRHRKQMFMSRTTPARIERLAGITADWLHSYAEKWTRLERVVLYPELCRCAGYLGDQITRSNEPFYAAPPRADLNGRWLPDKWSPATRPKATAWRG